MTKFMKNTYCLAIFIEVLYRDKMNDYFFQLSQTKMHFKKKRYEDKKWYICCIILFTYLWTGIRILVWVLLFLVSYVKSLLNQKNIFRISQHQIEKEIQSQNTHR